MMRGEQALRIAQELQLPAEPAYFHGLTMLPFLREGDLVRVVPVQWDEIRVGDVLTYRFEDKYPTRRVMRIDRPREQLILKGDSIPGQPAYVVARADILGRAVGRQRQGRWLYPQHWEWKWACARAILWEWVFQCRLLVRRLRRR